jgi:hypothetical protein
VQLYFDPQNMDTEVPAPAKHPTGMLERHDNKHCAVDTGERAVCGDGFLVATQQRS